MSLKLGASFWGRGVASWNELAGALKLPAPGDFPLPLPGGDLSVSISIEAVKQEDADAPPGFGIRLETEYEINPDEVSLLGFTPGRTCRLTFTGNVSPESAGGGAGMSKLGGVLAAEVAVKFPALPSLGPVRIRTGDAEGWTRLRLKAEAEADAGGDPSAAPRFKLSAEILDPFEADFFFPGVAQSEPPLHFEVRQIGGDIVFAGEKFGGILRGSGEFTFAPRLDAPDLPVADYLKPLLDDLVLRGPVGFVFSLSSDESAHRAALAASAPPADGQPARMIVAASVLLAGEQPEFCLCCKFTDAEEELFLFDLLRRLGGAHAGAEGEQAGETGIGFGLRGLCICLSQTPSFAIEVEALIGASVPAYLILTAGEVRVGVGHVLPGARPGLRIPLRLPRFSREEFGFPPGLPINRESRARADAHPLDRAIYESLPDEDGGGKDRYDQFLDAYFSVVEKLSVTGPPDKDLLLAYREGRGWKVRPPEGAAYDDDVPLRVAAGMVGERRPDGAFETTGELAVVCRLRGESEWRLLLARPALEFAGFFFSMSFRNPRDIRVGGSVRFLVEGPLSDISKFTLTLGLSADLIYFSLAADENARFDIPAFVPGYEGGSFAVGKLMFGFGYLKRSLAVAFAGELALPERLVDDLDTSDSLGAGVRLPVRSKLAFQFDLMPIVIGKVVIPVPLFQLNCDLRRDVSPGLRDARTCEPFWDGLQLIVPDVIRLSLKRISYSGMVAIHCSSNSDFDGDLALGDAENGLTVVADNIYWAYGVDSGAALMLAPVLSVPFCDNFCVRLRLGGFGLHFNLQRPIPSFSPLAVFELLALAADPLYEIAPRGELADMVRVTLADAHITLPEPARRLFPQSAELLHKPLNVTINIATFLTLCQRLAKTLKPFGSAVVDALKHGRRVAAGLEREAVALQAGDLRALPGDILAQLPPELRKVRLAADFAGFGASAVVVLADRGGALAALSARGRAAQTPPPGDDSDSELSVAAGGRRAAARDALAAAVGPGSKPNVRRAPGAPRAFDPNDADENVLGGIEFAGFAAADLEDVPPPLSSALLTVGDVKTSLALKLKTDDGPLGKLLRDRFSRGLRNSLAEFKGGKLPAALARLLVAELNRLLKGAAFERGTMYEPAIFAGINLGRPLRELLKRHEREPLRGQELLRLNRMLLEAAYPGALPESVGVLTGARVRVLGGQRFRFVGYVYADGAFSLVSAVEIDDLQLTVAGIPVPFPFVVHNRLRLAGRAKRDGFVGSVRAEGSGRWNVVPGLLHLEISADDPAALELYGDGRFAFDAHATAKLFDNPHCKLADATLSVSDTHCFVSGSFALTSALLGQQLLDISARAEGRVGPGRRFRIGFAAGSNAAGARQSRLLGVPLADFKGAVSESGVEFEARLAQGGSGWTAWPGGAAFKPPLRIVEASLEGRIDPRKKSPPDFGLEGVLALRLFDEQGPLINGRGGFSMRDGRPGAFAEGSLSWQGRDWLRGRVELSREEVLIEGDVSAAFSLSPGDIGISPSGNVRVSKLVFSLDLSGQFTLNRDGAIRTIKELRARCLLALSFAGSADQPFPLASAEASLGEPWQSTDAFHLPLLSVGALLPEGPAVELRKLKPTYHNAPHVPTGVSVPSQPIDLWVPRAKWGRIRTGPNSFVEGWVSVGDAGRQRVVIALGTPSLTSDPNNPIRIPTGVEFDMQSEPTPVPLAAVFNSPFSVSLRLDASGKKLCIDVAGRKFDLGGLSQN